MRLRLLATARRDLADIARHIALDNPAAADATTERVGGRLRDLLQFPWQGRLLRGDRRELVIAGTPYIAVYRIVGDEIRILRVLHGSRRR